MERLCQRCDKENECEELRAGGGRGCLITFSGSMKKIGGGKGKEKVVYAGVKGGGLGGSKR